MNHGTVSQIESLACRFGNCSEFVRQGRDSATSYTLVCFFISNREVRRVVKLLLLYPYVYPVIFCVYRRTFVFVRKSRIPHDPGLFFLG